MADGLKVGGERQRKKMEKEADGVRRERAPVAVVAAAEATVASK